MRSMYDKSARVYDALYSFIDYRAESELLRGIIEEYKKSSGRDLLDIACGTGQHLSYLREYYAVEGLDMEPDMLDLGRKRNPGVIFHHADMMDFKLPKKYDAIMCMFSSIGFVKTLTNLKLCLENFSYHLKPGGVLIVEPWVLRGNFIDGYLGSQFVDLPDLKVARINSSKIIDGISVLQMHYVVGTADGIEYFSERHEQGLFTNEEYLSAFTSAGLKSFYDQQGPKNKELYNRGLYIAVKPQEKSPN